MPHTVCSHQIGTLKACCLQLHAQCIVLGDAVLCSSTVPSCNILTPVVTRKQGLSILFTSDVLWAASHIAASWRMLHAGQTLHHCGVWLATHCNQICVQFERDVNHTLPQSDCNRLTSADLKGLQERLKTLTYLGTSPQSPVLWHATRSWSQCRLCSPKHPGQEGHTCRQTQGLSTTASGGTRLA